MDFEKVTHPSLLNDDITRNILSFPESGGQEKTQWDKTVERMQKVELKAQEDLKKLREDSVPESVQRIIQDVKKIYAQRTYHINGGFGIYDGMEVLWDKKTEEVQNIILSVKIGSNTLHFHVDPDNEYLLRNSQPDIFGDGKSQDIGSQNPDNLPIRIWTKEWQEQYIAEYRSNMVTSRALQKKKKNSGGTSPGLSPKGKMLTQGGENDLLSKTEKYAEGLDETQESLIAKHYGPFLSGTEVNIPMPGIGNSYNIRNFKGKFFPLPNKSETVSVPVGLVIHSSGGEEFLIVRRTSWKGYQVIPKQGNTIDSHVSEYGAFFAQMNGESREYLYKSSDSSPGKFSLEPTKLQKWIDTRGKSLGIHYAKSGESSQLEIGNTPISQLQASVLVEYAGKKRDIGFGEKDIQYQCDGSTGGMAVIGRTESADFVHLGIEKDGKTTLSMTPSISKYPNKRLLAESFQKDVNASVHKFTTT